MRSDHQSVTTWSSKSDTPVVIKTGKRFLLNIIYSLTNQGKLQFMLFKEGFTVSVFIDFLSRLIKYNRRKVFLIVDGHPTHKAKMVKQWIENHSDRIELFLLPGYCPELNPDELVNQDVKTNAVEKKDRLTLTNWKPTLKII